MAKIRGRTCPAISRIALSRHARSDVLSSIRNPDTDDSVRKNNATDKSSVTFPSQAPSGQLRWKCPIFPHLRQANCSLSTLLFLSLFVAGASVWRLYPPPVLPCAEAACTNGMPHGHNTGMGKTTQLHLMFTMPFCWRLPFRIAHDPRVNTGACSAFGTHWRFWPLCKPIADKH